ncbi:MAG: hypothetical protein COA76_13225 [Moritella sp.]|uniref:hypothetical protein n=1 Tax=Moritella sp. TaxID=78556 RepID=UPI000C102EDA|nr:hypothetical protein [Moritella sp.]MBL1417227.1 hypothetical protein [Moritella sp.]PHR87002.1 MAG: hypothetical protein COA76_13225 [Moritella sp.]
MFYKFLISLMLCAVISLFFISKPDGQKILTPAVIQQDITHAFAQVTTSISNTQREIFADSNDSPKSVTLYRWQDDQGQWHFTDDENNQPNRNQNAQTNAITITANSSLAVNNKSHTAAMTGKNEQPQTSATDTLLRHPLANAFNTLQDAKNIQTLMDNHGKQLDNAIKNIGN